MPRLDPLVRKLNRLGSRRDTLLKIPGGYLESQEILNQINKLELRVYKRRLRSGDMKAIVGIKFFGNLVAEHYAMHRYWKKFAERYRSFKDIRPVGDPINVRIPTEKTDPRAKSARFALLYSRTEGRPKQGISESIQGL